MNTTIPVYEANQLHSEFLAESKLSATKLIQKLSLRRDVHLGDRLFFWFVRVLAILTIVLLLSIGYFLFQGAYPAIKAFHWDFLSKSVWDPVRDVYGALPVVYGTVVSSILGILIATPFSVGIALFITELAPRKLGVAVGLLVEMLAAIPSVVYGLWGIFILIPWLRTDIQPWMIQHFGWIPFFQGPAYGVGMLSAGIILAIMVTPTISSISREVFRAIPLSQREGALALGATRWEMIRVAVLKSSYTGVFGAVILGLGRALGETMAVTMVIGNRSEIVASLFAPSQTMASVIANEYAEATSDTHLAALAYVGLLLFAVTFLVNSVARFLVWRVTKSPKRIKV